MSVLQPVTAPTDTVVRATNLTKTYGKADTAVVALKSVNVELGRGEFTAIMGPSGSGKSTLMHCLAGLDKITEGEVSIDGEIISGMTERKLTKLRRDRIGFIFQSFNLIPTLTAEENITLPADIAKKKVSKERFDKVVDAVGLRNRLTHRPAEMSGGQQQRVACARALITEPAVVFADEPTGNLDSKSSTQVLRFLREAVDDLGQTVVMVTHDPTAASFADRVLFLLDGRVIAQLDNPTRERVLDALLELDNLRETDETDDEAPATETEGGESDSPARRGGDGEEPAPTSSSSQADEGAASGSAAATQATPGTPGSTERATQATPATPAPQSSATPATPATQSSATPDTPAGKPHASSDGKTPATPAGEPQLRKWHRHPASSSQAAPSMFDASAPRPGERLDEALRRMAPAADPDEETLNLLRHAQEILSDLPGSVIPEDDLELTGPIPIVRRRPETNPESDGPEEHA